MPRKRNRRRAKRIVLVALAIAAVIGLSRSEYLMVAVHSDGIAHYERKLTRELRKRGVVAYWDFDDIRVNEWGKNGLEITDGTRVVAGKYGKARRFVPDENGYVESATLLNVLGSEHTVSCWIKLSAGPDEQCIFQYLYVENDRLVYRIHSRRGKPELSCPLPPAGEFFHFAVAVGEAEGKAALYIDGIKKDEAAVEFVVHKPEAVRFGQHKYGPVADFVLDDVVFWNKPLTAEEVNGICVSDASVGESLVSDTILRLSLVSSVAKEMGMLASVADMFNPFLHGGTADEMGIERIDLELSKADIKAFALYDDRRRRCGFSSLDTSKKRKVMIDRKGSTYKAKLEIVGTQYDAQFRYGRRAYAVHAIDGQQGNGTAFLLDPWEGRPFLLPGVAAALAARSGIGIPAPQFCLLRINGGSIGIYMLRNQAGSAPLPWDMEAIDSVIRSLPVFREEVLDEFDKLAVRMFPLLENDTTSGWHGRKVSHSISQQREYLVDHVVDDQQRTDDTAVERMAAFLDEKMFLGHNACKELVTADLDFSTKVINGVNVRYSSSNTNVLSDSGHIVRPGSWGQSVVKVMVRLHCGGADGKKELEFSVLPRVALLPVLTIDTWNEVSDGKRVSAVGKLLDLSGKDSPVTFSSRVKYRGNSSLLQEKKYYSIKLDRARDLLGIGKRGTLLLTSGYHDRTLMKDKLSFDIFRGMGLTDMPRYAPDFRFVELVVNGEYRGVYCLSDRVDGAMLEFDTTLADGQQPVLYKSMGTHASFRKVTKGSYLQKVPHWKKGPYWGPYEELMNFVATTDSVDFARRVESVVDVNSVLDFELLLNFAADGEGARYNLYIARGPEADAGFFIVPWDYDKTYSKGLAVWLQNRLLERLHSDLSGYNKRMQGRWRELRKLLLSEPAVMARIDGMERELDESGAAARNYARWPLSSGGSNHQESVVEMKKWIAARLLAMDTIIASFDGSKQ